MEYKSGINYYGIMNGRRLHWKEFLVLEVVESVGKGKIQIIQIEAVKKPLLMHNENSPELRSTILEFPYWSTIINKPVLSFRKVTSIYLLKLKSSQLNQNYMF